MSDPWKTIAYGFRTSGIFFAGLISLVPCALWLGFPEWVPCIAPIFVVGTYLPTSIASKVPCPRCHQPIVFSRSALFNYPVKACIHCGLPWGTSSTVGNEAPSSRADPA